MSDIQVRRALISVSDKTGLDRFARRLAAAGIELYSTGGTRAHLEQAGLAVRDVAEYTGFPEMMDGRIKTLHPKIFGGILARHDNAEDLRSLAEHGILSFELVVVNLYPFAATAARHGATPAEIVEMIDIGGPSLVRAAAKNHAFVAIATDPAQYAELAEHIERSGTIPLATRRTLAAAAFEHTARYDRAIANWFAGSAEEASFPPVFGAQGNLRQVLRYGENPHQAAALYADPAAAPANLVAARQLHGKELSYNNLLDLDSAWAIARSFEEPAAVVIKHNNPCGAAVHTQLAEAARQAMDGDPTSAFGSVLAFNRTVDLATADVLATPGLFVEAIVAPDFAPEAIELLTTKPKWKASIRLLAVGAATNRADRLDLRQIDGGFLVQQPDTTTDSASDWRVATARAPSDAELADLRFAWNMVRFVKSNAITIARAGSLIGVGAGQMSRVDSVEIAIRKAGDRVRGAVLASDAFFPFPDSIELAAAAGIAAVAQPGGSRNDPDVIAACDRHGIAMLLTDRRHFKH